MQVILGTIVGVFGIKGEVKVKSNTDFGVIRFKKGNKVELCSKIGMYLFNRKKREYKTTFFNF